MGFLSIREVVASIRAAVMAITKMSIWVPPVNLFTGGGRDVLRQCGRTPAMVAGSRRRMIMSKTNSESREVRESRELTNDELAHVVGGRHSAAQLFRDARADFAHGDVRRYAGPLADAYKALGSNLVGWDWGGPSGEANSP